VASENVICVAEFTETPFTTIVIRAVSPIAA